MLLPEFLQLALISVLSPEAPSFLSEQVTCRAQEFDTGDSLFSFYFFSYFLRLELYSPTSDTF
jgi:hypothetical protein